MAPTGPGSHLLNVFCELGGELGAVNGFDGFSLGAEPAVAPRRVSSGDGGSKDGGKRVRGESAANKVKIAQLLLQSHLQQFQQLATTNVLLKARAQVLELVIGVRDLQVERLEMIRRGLPFNVTEPLGCTLDELAACTPAWFAERFTAIGGQLAERLAAVMPLLDQYPDLGTSNIPAPPKPEALTAAVSMGHIGLMRTPTLPLSFSPDAPEAQMADRLLDLLKDMTVLQQCLPWCYLAVPKLLLGASSSVHTIASMVTSWDDIARSTSLALDSSGGGGGTSGAPLPVAQTKCKQGEPPDSGAMPALAPEEHWHHVVSLCKLSDAQILQCRALADCITPARQRVLTQRASLIQAMTALYEHQLTTGCGSGTHLSESGSHTPPLHRNSGDLTWTKTPHVITQESIIMDQLHNTLVKERCLVLLMAEVLFHYTLGPLQSVIVMGSSWPYVPDELAILHAAASLCTSQVVDRLVEASLGEQ